MTRVAEHPAGTGASTGRAAWALWGTAAGVLGVVANAVAQPQVSEAQRQAGFDQAFGLLGSGTYRVGAVAGFLAVAALVLLAAGFRRWAAGQPSTSLALHALPYALLASAGALTAGYGVKGQLAAYLDGGFNAGSYPDRDLYVYFLLDDLAGFFGWWGVAVAMACLAWLAFRERLVPRWIGAVATLAAVVPLLFLLVFGFTGFAGVITPVALVVVGTGLALRRS